MMKTKEEMMKEAIKMGLNAGAAGCIAVFTAEELEMILNNSKPTEPQKDEKELRKEIIAQVYAEQINELIDRLDALGYDVIVNGESHETYDGIEIDHKNKVVDITTW